MRWFAKNQHDSGMRLSAWVMVLALIEGHASGQCGLAKLIRRCSVFHLRIFVALLCLFVSAAEVVGQCSVTPIPMGDGTTKFDNSPVDLDGDVAVIGDLSDIPFGTFSGSVKVRRFNGTVWVEEAILTASSGAAEDRFGTKVAVSGDVIAVGAPAWQNPASDGATYIFRYNSTIGIWEEETILTSQTAASSIGINFGSNLALSGDVVAIAGTTLNGIGEDIMGAHIFRYNPITFTWDFEQVLTIEEDFVGAWFPNNWLALDGNVLIAGEPVVTRIPSFSGGAARIYRYDGATWNLDVKISSSSTDADFFGIGVEVLGDMAVIGTTQDSELPSGKLKGAVYVYEYDGVNWNFTQKVTPVGSELIEDSDFFGQAISLASDAMLVGIMQMDEPITPIINAGAVYYFKREGAAWLEQGRMFAPDAMVGDQFSRMGIAISGDRAIISSSRRNDVSGLGQAYIVDGFRGIGESDCNNNGIADSCDILEATSADLNTNGIPDECEAVINPGQTAIINSTGGSGEPIAEPLVEVSNVIGAAGSTVTVDVSGEDLHPGAGEFGILDMTVAIETSMNDGEFFMTVTMPFDDVDLAGESWQSVEILFFNTLTSTWETAVLGNTQNSPGFAGPAGDRFLSQDSVDHNLASLSNDLGDFGVFWNNVTLMGFAWANIDHTTDFSIGIDLCPADTDDNGTVNVTDLLELLAMWGACPGLCRSDTNNDGNVNVTDLLALLAAWGACS